jgi:hypothetical protein
MDGERTMNGEQALLEIHKNVSSLREDVAKVMTEGCAKREGDLSRITHVEDGIKSLGDKMDRLFWTTLITALGIIAFLAKAFLPYLLR